MSQGRCEVGRGAGKEEDDEKVPASGKALVKDITFRILGCALDA